MQLSNQQLSAFVAQVIGEGAKHYRDFAWRRTTDPYSILLSEIMLQQTQVIRVESYFDTWVQRFPTVDSLAAADTTEVLEAWQGLGYNRRALALKRLAVEVSESRNGMLPASYEELQTLPGVGPATAAGVMAFAHNSFAPYLETNVRSVVLHELFADNRQVCDRDVMTVVQQVSDYLAGLGKASTIDARTWNYALLDYGAWLKKAFPNPSRRSKQHTRQSKFEGSFRQKRAVLLREILSMPKQDVTELAAATSFDVDVVERVLAALLTEGFIKCDNSRYSISD